MIFVSRHFQPLNCSIVTRNISVGKSSFPGIEKQHASTCKVCQTYRSGVTDRTFSEQPNLRKTHTHTQFFDQKCERPHSAFRILDSSNPSLPVRPLWGLLFGCYVFGASRRVWKPRRTWPKEFSLNIQNPPNTWWGSVFGTLKSLLRRCLGFQTPIHQVFGCLGFKGFKQIPPLLMGAFGKFSNPRSRSWRLCELQLAQFFGVFFFFLFSNLECDTICYCFYLVLLVYIIYINIMYVTYI